VGRPSIRPARFHSIFFIAVEELSTDAPRRSLYDVAGRRQKKAGSQLVEKGCGLHKAGWKMGGHLLVPSLYFSVLFSDCHLFETNTSAA